MASRTLRSTVESVPSAPATRARMKASITSEPALMSPLDVTWIMGAVLAASSAVASYPSPEVEPLQRAAQATIPASRASIRPACPVTMRPVPTLGLPIMALTPTEKGDSLRASAPSVVVMEPAPTFPDHPPWFSTDPPPRPNNLRG